MGRRGHLGGASDQKAEGARKNMVGTFVVVSVGAGRPSQGLTHLNSFMASSPQRASSSSLVPGPKSLGEGMIALGVRALHSPFPTKEMF